MPELPEVETTKRGILPHLLSQTIRSIEIHDDRLRWQVSEPLNHLKNLLVKDIFRRAKYLLLRLETDQHIMIHLGMSGSLRILNSEEPLKKHDHLVFHLSNGLQMRYHDPRRFGCVLLIDGDVHQHALLKKLGPEPLSDDFSVEYFIQKSTAKKACIKQHIMQNQTVVGVGNIYACEALFLSGIHPKRLAGKISKTRLTHLHQTIRTVLAKAIQQGGTTLRDFTNSEGKPGYFKQELAVYDRENKPCHQCESTIKRIIIGQRSTFYCPKCQK